MIKKKILTKNNTLTVRIFYNLQNPPTFHSEERLVNLARGRECFVGLSIYTVLLVYNSYLLILNLLDGQLLCVVFTCVINIIS